MIECKICGKMKKALNAQHLRTHGIENSTEYRKLFPGAPVTSPELSERFATNSESRFIERYGAELGKRKYAEYREFQSRKNTREYKKEKYGWSDDDFNEFNKSRAVTIENLIRRHGEEKGNIIWKQYCERQAYAGNSLEYFIEKYGEEEGQRRYVELNDKKRHNIENYTRLYGDDAEIKLEEYFSNTFQNRYFTSAPHIEFLNLLHNRLSATWKYHDAIHDKEFVVYDAENKKVFMYDFVITNPFKACIEFNGDYYHCNPKIYSENFIIRTGATSKEVWDSDAMKLNAIQSRGFKTLIIWESDFNANKTQSINEVMNWLLRVSQE